jgi:hypothetical protein
MVSGGVAEPHFVLRRAIAAGKPVESVAPFALCLESGRREIASHSDPTRVASAPHALFEPGLRLLGGGGRDQTHRYGVGHAPAFGRCPEGDRVRVVVEDRLEVGTADDVGQYGRTACLLHQ